MQDVTMCTAVVVAAGFSTLCLLVLTLWFGLIGYNFGSPSEQRAIGGMNWFLLFAFVFAGVVAIWGTLPDVWKIGERAAAIAREEGGINWFCFALVTYPPALISAIAKFAPKMGLVTRQE